MDPAAAAAPPNPARAPIVTSPPTIPPGPIAAKADVIAAAQRVQAKDLVLEELRDIDLTVFRQSSQFTRLVVHQHGHRDRMQACPAGFIKVAPVAPEIAQLRIQWVGFAHDSVAGFQPGQ